MKNLLLIVNPRAGQRQGRTVARTVLPILEQAGLRVELRETAAPGHARELAARFAPDRFDTVGVIGGDGTVHEVVNGLMERPPAERVPLGVIPAGTGNSLMHDLGCLDPVAAARRLVTDPSRPLDLLEVRAGGRIRRAFNVVGWGMWAEGNRIAEGLRRTGRWRYDLAVFWLILRRPLWPGQLTCDPAAGEAATFPGPFAFILASNTVHTGRGMRAAPRARFDDGLLDLIHVRPLPRRTLASLFSRIYRGEHVASSFVHYRQIRGFKVTGVEDGLLNLDGELVAGGGDFQVRVLPAALQLLGARAGSSRKGAG